MGWFRKLLGLKQPSVEEVKAKEEAKAFPQPEGNLIGQCLLCQLAIGEQDIWRKLPSPPGAIAHKKCIKKSQKMMFQGLSQEEIGRRLNGTSTVE